MRQQVGEDGQRGHVLRLLGEIRYNEDSFVDAIPLLEDALDHAATPDTVVTILLDLAFAT